MTDVYELESKALPGTVSARVPDLCVPNKHVTDVWRDIYFGGVSVGTMYKREAAIVEHKCNHFMPLLEALKHSTECRRCDEYDCSDCYVNIQRTKAIKAAEEVNDNG